MKINLSHGAAMVVSCFIFACTTNAQVVDKPNARIEKTAVADRLSQYQLDAAFRRQSQINEATGDFRNEYELCCIVFHDDFKLLSKVFEHFQKNTDQSVDDYGLLVQANEDEYWVHIGERYKEENQFFARDKWHPGSSSHPLPNYRYRVDRETLEIKEFREFLN